MAQKVVLLLSNNAYAVRSSENTVVVKGGPPALEPQVISLETLEYTTKDKATHKVSELKGGN